MLCFSICLWSSCNFTFYFYVIIFTENGKTKVTKTGNNGSSKDITPKVEVYRKSLNKTIVKFEFTIKITNEGDIPGYAREITDYVPKGLKFYKEDNKGWKDEGNNVISTELLKNTLLKPGQSATVKVVLFSLLNLRTPSVLVCIYTNLVLFLLSFLPVKL